MAGKTIKDLRKIAEDLGYESREQVQKILEASGLGGEFDPARFREYVVVLTVHAQKLEALLGRIETDNYKYRLDPCPVCGSECERVRNNGARLFGPVWRCLKGGEAHYVWARADQTMRAAGLSGLDFEKMEKMSVGRRERDETIRRLYWKAVAGSLSEDEQQEFIRAYLRQ